ncbi:MAG: hypothetical protein KGL19_09020, partial [Bacteroidota bacterium]|nr:hypothetical protein [Bacteroidota bacterium]
KSLINKVEGKVKNLFGGKHKNDTNNKTDGSFEADEATLNKIWADAENGFNSVKQLKVIGQQGSIFSLGKDYGSTITLAWDADFIHKEIIANANTLVRQWAEHNSIIIVDANKETLGKKTFNLNKDNKTIGLLMISHSAGKPDELNYIAFQLYDNKMFAMMNK